MCFYYFIVLPQFPLRYEPNISLVTSTTIGHVNVREKQRKANNREGCHGTVVRFVLHRLLRSGDVRWDSLLPGQRSAPGIRGGRLGDTFLALRLAPLVRQICHLLLSPHRWIACLSSSGLVCFSWFTTLHLKTRSVVKCCRVYWSTKHGRCVSMIKCSETSAQFSVSLSRHHSSINRSISVSLTLSVCKS